MFIELYGARNCPCPPVQDKSSGQVIYTFCARRVKAMDGPNDKQCTIGIR